MRNINLNFIFVMSPVNTGEEIKDFESNGMSEYFITFILCSEKEKGKTCSTA